MCPRPVCGICHEKLAMPYKNENRHDIPVLVPVPVSHRFQTVQRRHRVYEPPRVSCTSTEAHANERQKIEVTNTRWRNQYADTIDRVNVISFVACPRS